MTIKQFYSTHIFHAMARLDVPTFEDPVVQRQLEAASSISWRSSVAWETVRMTSSVMSTAIRLLSQVSVLVSVLRHQQDGPLLALLSFSQSLFQWFSGKNFRHTSLGAFSISYFAILLSPFSSVWAATTKDDDFIRMQGYKHLVDNPVHRKEVVAGSLGEHLTQRTRHLAHHILFADYSQYTGILPVVSGTMQPTFRK